MIPFTAFGDLTEIDVGEFADKPTTLTPGQKEAAVTLYKSAGEALEVGVWECTPGRFTSDRSTFSEICHILSGRLTLHNQDGSSRHFGPGEMFDMPLGWRGEWTIHETVRKIYLIISKPI